MSIARVCAVLGAVALSFAAAPTTAFAASPLTNAFLTNLIPNVDFLDRSSRLAHDVATSPRLREFARTEAAQQTIAANSVDEWVRADRAAQVVLSQMAETGDAVPQTGRSVAIDTLTADAPAPVAIPDRAPMGQGDLDALQTLSGPAFDAAYRLKQLEALRQIEADYMTYIARGDDPILLGIANRELPQVERRIAQLRRL